ncbi:YbhB/YbcL family Raf kinase inhibitor-like protein [Spirosoma sp. HMF3257]|uniref:YbhB/YbcL family Raf kinase inhibitor-like protein n=1 Tax=Spirosoma telluris TaxID=2183553 RepID=A0A327NKI1_9BACT|nr:YbhB/YbcL family Raf kinase inhibitor-like protein [Spirosoma telluris]RAI75682.1 YbhB/YbcL family Raf kinase inhibitor-like protein [Spirosoma telluris]
MGKFWRIPTGILLLVVVIVIGMHIRAKYGREKEEKYLTMLKKNIALSSNSFPPNGDMPEDCSCRGKGVSPALMWETGELAIKSYVILTTDYDVPTPAFPVFNLSHWVIYNLPASVRSIPEAVTSEQMQMLGGKIGKNSMGKSTFIAACPPAGRHAYVFRVYALDQLLAFSIVPDKHMILDAMNGHVLGYGELTGYFQ